MVTSWPSIAQVYYNPKSSFFFGGSDQASELESTCLLYQPPRGWIQGHGQHFESTPWRQNDDSGLDVSQFVRLPSPQAVVVHSSTPALTGAGRREVQSCPLPQSSRLSVVSCLSSRLNYENRSRSKGRDNSNASIRGPFQLGQVGDSIAEGKQELDLVLFLYFRQYLCSPGWPGPCSLTRLALNSQSTWPPEYWD